MKKQAPVSKRRHHREGHSRHSLEDLRDDHAGRSTWPSDTPPIIRRPWVRDSHNHPVGPPQRLRSTLPPFFMNHAPPLGPSAPARWPPFNSWRPQEGWGFNNPPPGSHNYNSHQAPSRLKSLPHRSSRSFDIHNRISSGSIPYRSHSQSSSSIKYVTFAK